MPTLTPVRRREVADEALVRNLFTEHGGAMLGYATQLTRDRAAAEDIVQEALVRAWRHPESLANSKGSVRGWLLTVIRNIWHDRHRARMARPQETLDAPVNAAIEKDHADQVVNAMVVVDSLSRLSPEHRKVLELIYLQGHSVAETAEILSVPSGTVKSRTFYGLRALREMHAGDETLKGRSAA